MCERSPGVPVPAGSSDKLLYLVGVALVYLSNERRQLQLKVELRRKGRLKLLASNYSLVKGSDVSILPTYRKPFDMIAEGPSRLNWLPGRDSNPRPIG